MLFTRLSSSLPYPVRPRAGVPVVNSVVWDMQGGCMTLAGPRLIRFVLGAAILVASIGSQPVAASTASIGATREISASGRAGFTASQPAGTAGVEAYETPAAGGDGAQVFDRSHSGSGDSTPVGAISQPKNVTNSAPGVLASFEGINHFQQRFGSANQFSLEPPDQGLCIGSDGGGNTRVLEVVNDTLRVYTTGGAALTGPVALNAFYGYAPAIIRSSLTFGPFVTDPSCIYDAPTGRWFISVLTLDTFPHPGSDGQEHFTGTNHL